MAQLPCQDRDCQNTDGLQKLQSLFCYNTPTLQPWEPTMKPDENSVDNNALLHKMITRTDSYLNYANTKSTIIITFITALIAFVGEHAGNAIHYLKTIVWI